MIELLKNHVAGEWVVGTGDGHTLTDPVTGEALARVSSEGLDLSHAFRFARDEAGAALRALTYAERAARLADVVKLLQSKREDYYAIALANSGTTRNDSAVDIDGGIFTLSYYARLGASLGNVHALRDGNASALSKDQSFSVQHVLTPTRGVALFINAFNFPSWGLWEKAAPAFAFRRTRHRQARDRDGVAHATHDRRCGRRGHPATRRALGDLRRLCGSARPGSGVRCRVLHGLG